jgi:hemin uptake protein HemP
MAALPTRPALAPTPQPEASPAAGGTAPAPAALPRWRSSELFGSAREVEIEHGDAVYRLRQTALGKLILTK